MTVNKDTELPEQVLLIEDDAALRTLLAGIIGSKGYHILQAERRDEALEMLNDFPDIAAIVCDLGLPPQPHNTVEGLATIRDIQKIPAAPKIIVLTGQDQESSALEAIREGAFDFLPKPAQADQILSALDRALLFHRKERDLASDGVTRLQINAKVADGLKAVREDAEEKLIRQVLKDTGFNVYQSAAQLGVKRESIYYFMKKFGIQRDDG
tara:strand:- start:832 stop:1464 length:633 start_codon:yes stop_codon:yes gene_type:complete